MSVSSSSSMQAVQGDTQSESKQVFSLSQISECVKTASGPGECHGECGMNIVSHTLSNTGYGSSLQSAQGGVQLLSSEHITQEFGMPEDLCGEKMTGIILYRRYISTVHLSGRPSHTDGGVMHEGGGCMNNDYEISEAEESELDKNILVVSVYQQIG